MSHPCSTDDVSDVPILNQRQESVLTALLGGATDSEAARTAGVTRETVCRWRRSNPDFAAEFNRRRMEISEATSEALRALGLRAVNALGEALNAPQPHVRLRAAALVLEVLREGSSRLQPNAIGPTEAAGIREEWKREEESKRWKRELDAQLGFGSG